MNRITVEDCLEKINSRFELIVLASKRARYLSFNKNQARVNINLDKSTIIALREIAHEKITKSEIYSIDKI